MAISIFDENTPHDGTEFFPFDDSRSGAIKRAALEGTIERTPMNTQDIDAFRQGIEITTEAHRMRGLGAKVWAGNIKGYTQIRTLGQALTFTEDENSIIWEELPVFDPVAFIQMGENYPRPIIFNEGPQQNKETRIEPFTIPFRAGLDTVELSENAHAVRGNVEDGNADIRTLNGANNQVMQFIDLRETTDMVPFLDDGVQYYGPIGESIHVPAFLNDGDATITPFDDVGNDNIINQLSTTDVAFLTVLKVTSSINLNEDIRQKQGVRSAAAGTDVYGPEQGQYGTDSVAYVGFFRGS